jgi:hypothetical protein
LTGFLAGIKGSRRERQERATVREECEIARKILCWREILHERKIMLY